MNIPSAALPGRPVRFRIGSGAPKAIIEQDERRVALLINVEEIDEKVREAERQLPQDRADDLRDAADALAAGREPPKKSRETARLEEIAKLARLRPAALLLCNEEAASEAHAIVEHADEWQQLLDTREQAAADRFRAALATLDDAASELADVRATQHWLARWDPYHPDSCVTATLRIPAAISDANSRPQVDAVIDALKLVADVPEDRDSISGERIRATAVAR